MSNLISAADLIRLIPGSDILIADCRFDLADPGLGERQYLERHVQGAVYCSLDRDLSASVTIHGGRHPLPPVPDMVSLFERIGVTSGKIRVVAYDNSGGPFAARLWWMLRYLGHEQVQILDGGFALYLQAGGPLSNEEQTGSPGSFHPDIRHSMLASVEDAREDRSTGRLYDSRAPERHKGILEEIDPVAGHIPGSANLFWMDNLKNDNTFKPIPEIEARFSRLDSDSIFYCGSGVTACVNILAMEESGKEIPRLYNGSWSDWISYPENPITGPPHT